MKQVLQSLKNGRIQVTEVPVPSVRKGQLLIKTSTTLISAGTERMLVEFGKANWAKKAQQQPDKVRMVLDKIKTDGLRPTIEAVFNKLDQPLPLGYCNVGRVIQTGPGVKGFEIRERVISNGQHAEIVSVPVNLCAKVPEGVSDEEASFTVLGAIALQGVRLAQPTLGETVVVIGLGLIGLITVQLLRAHGCRVLGIDFDKQKLELARLFGAEIVDLSTAQDPIIAAQLYSRGHGVDAVIIAASTKSNDPVHQAAQMCRKRGRIVLIGSAGLELSRADFFEKELTFQVSCSYGPGRYDPNYEERGNDYPIGFVRWTEQRNFEAVLDMIAEGRLNIKPLISHRFDISDAKQAYALVSGSIPVLGILLCYPSAEVDLDARTITLSIPSGPNISQKKEELGVSFIGAGNYATAMLIPAFKAAGARLRSVVSSAGISGLHAACKFGFEETTTDTGRVFKDKETQIVAVTTRHNSHAFFVLEAIRSGKHVFVEKPLCMNLEELEEIEATCIERNAQDKKIPTIMVGFNRRFAPQVKRIKQLLNGVMGPKTFVMMVNAGAVSPEHWTQDITVGGGRILGEACHFIDLLRFLAGSSIMKWHVSTLETISRDTTTLQLSFADGSMGTVHYFANGSKKFPKERLEIFTNGRVLQLDNFRRLSGYGWPGFSKMNLWRQDKGQKACTQAFVAAITEGKPSPIPLSEIMEVSRVTIQIAMGSC